MRKLFIISLALCLVLTGCFSAKNAAGPNYSSKMSRLEYIENALLAIDKRDKAALLELFSDESKSRYDLDTEIDAAFDFFEGTINYVDRSYEAASNSMESWRDGDTEYIFVEPHISDVRTTAGKSYEIVLGAYLINADDEAKEGISYLSIYDNANEDDFVNVGGYEN
ncbi:MAG: DUF5104 domain-containing protein [Firmicutes bacterium]|nr:DUF5104 domain-containing protein [Bacillota bacterium]